jgi:16S rRNA (guanine527-N7)-methyltransferase
MLPSSASSSIASPRKHTLNKLLESGLSAEIAGRLALYGTLVLDSNRKFNLTGAKSEDELVEHLLDSLTVIQYVSEPYIDVGSGAGFPAIPVAVATGVRVTLIETTRKKAVFLRDVMETLGIDGDVVAERAEVAAHDEKYREQFASATARAVAVAPTVAELVLPFLRKGGIAILQRGTIDARERTALEDASLMLGATVETEHLLDGERRILLLRKTAATALRFPRRTGIPEKRPLCM